MFSHGDKIRQDINKYIYPLAYSKLYMIYRGRRCAPEGGIVANARCIWRRKKGGNEAKRAQKRKKRTPAIPDQKGPVQTGQAFGDLVQPRARLGMRALKGCTAKNPWSVSPRHTIYQRFSSVLQLRRHDIALSVETQFVAF
jgi:hypothetical protein